MAMLCIECPETGKLIPTGWDVDRASFESMTISNCSVRCNECGQSHKWSKEDAVFADPEKGPYHAMN